MGHGVSEMIALTGTIIDNILDDVMCVLKS